MPFPRLLSPCLAVLSVTLSLALAPAAAQADRSIIVLDASGSMWGQIGGTPKLEIARNALAEVLAGVSPEAEIGLMAYGHRERGNCADIELVVPPAPGTGPAIAEAARALRFQGKTPLTEAVRQAAAALRSTEEKATVILITDGLETCAADPCALGRELEASGVDFTAHVVGFGLSDEEGRQVACLAENTGGVYIQASDAGGLASALQQTVAAVPEAVISPPAPPAPPPAPEPQAVAENFAPKGFAVAGGPELPDDAGTVWELRAKTAEGTAGDLVVTAYGRRPQPAPAGDYILVARLDRASVSLPLTVAERGVTAPEVVFDAGRLTITVKTDPAGDAVDGGYWEMRLGGESIDYGYTRSTLYFPEGEYILFGRVGSAEAETGVTLLAGEERSVDLIVASGLVVVNASYVPGMDVGDGGQFVEVLSARTALDGSRQSIDYGYGPNRQFTLPPGDYITAVRLGEVRVEMPFTIRANERTELDVVLNAGVLAVTAPGAGLVEILAGRTDIQGNRASIHYEYGETASQIVAPGSYLIRATQGDAKVEAMAEVAAGERTEITVPLP